MNSRMRENLIKFILRMKNMIIRPDNEWQTIKIEETSRAKVLAGYCAPLAAIPPVVVVADRFISGRNIVSNAVHSPFVYVLATNMVWYLVIILNMVITGMVITAVASRERSEWLGLRGLQLAVYSFTPLFLVSSLIVILKFNWLVYGAIVHSVYLLYLGIRTLYDAEKKKAAWDAAVSFTAAGVILGMLNMFEYMLESYIAGRVFFDHPL